MLWHLQGIRRECYWLVKERHKDCILQRICCRFGYDHHRQSMGQNPYAIDESAHRQKNLLRIFWLSLKDCCRGRCSKFVAWLYPYLGTICSYLDHPTSDNWSPVSSLWLQEFVRQGSDGQKCGSDKLIFVRNAIVKFVTTSKLNERNSPFNIEPS